MVLVTLDPMIVLLVLVILETKTKVVDVLQVPMKSKKYIVAPVTLQNA